MEASAAPEVASPSPAATGAPAPGASPAVAPLNEEEEVEQLREMFKKSSPATKKKKKARTAREMPPWNDTPLRPAPWALRGLKTNREPWAEDANVYNAKFGNLHEAKFAPSNNTVLTQGNGMTRHLPEVRHDGAMWRG